MRKIQTIFKRNQDMPDKGYIRDAFIFPDELMIGGLELRLKDMIPTEKVDGTNVRVTIRQGKAVRLEKRRNPSKLQKKEGIIHPWYVDACKEDPTDKWIFDALSNTPLINYPDGEWPAEAVGEKIQGNPLNLVGNMLCFFTLDRNLQFNTPVPISFNELKAWLPLQKSKIGMNCGIEGIVWHSSIMNEPMYKIKLKDFK